MQALRPCPTGRMPCGGIWNKGRYKMGNVKVTKCPIEGLYIIEPALYGDSRGYFTETYNQRDLAAQGLDMVFVQDNQSMSGKGVLRGLHFQKQQPQGRNASKGIEHQSQQKQNGVFSLGDQKV